MDGACCLCKEALEPGRGLVFEPPCGHRYHFVCVSKLLPPRRGCQRGAELAGTGECRLACEICTELACSERDGLALAKRECSREILREKPVDAEFWLGTELLVGRQVTRLSEVPRAALYLRGLRCLDFTAHPISQLPREISLMSSLRRLVFVSVNLTELPEEVGELKQLEQLFATGCQLRSLPGSINKLENLWEFYFDGNQLRSLPNSLPPYIDSLKVSGNELTQLPEFHSQMKNIRAYGNRITELPSSICRCSGLCDVLMQGNELRSLPEEIGQARSIRTLLVHDNHIERLPDSVADLKDLRWLYLYNNNLRDLPDDLLSRLPCLERLLIESNPLSGPTMVDILGDVPRHLRLLGVDASQVETYHMEVSGDPPPLPSNVVAGWMLPWGRLYGKLAPASQLRRPAGVEAVRGASPVYGGDVLVVAFAASQGEPEWFGVLGQLLGKELPRISRGRVRDFADLHREIWGSPPSEDGEKAAQRAVAAMWLAGDKPENGVSKKPRIEQAEDCGAGQPLVDFDVLSVCETNAQWYTDRPGRHLGVEAHLAEITQRYRRVMFIGTSMGGFGALSNAHLAHTVAVFGPQTDLTISHLRPGFDPKDLEAATARMRANVDRAVRAGTRIEYHVAMEDHLLYARNLPLPPGSLVVHPLYGRIARILERGGVLAPIIVELISELQSRPAAADGAPSAAARPSPTAGLEEFAGPYAWDWESDAHQVLLGKWDHDADSALSFVRASGRQLLLLCQDPPKYGDWFCTHCWWRHDEQAASCPTCGMSCGGAPMVGPPWSARPPRARWQHRSNRAACRQCGQEPSPEAVVCPSCAALLPRYCPNCHSEQLGGRRDEVVGTWYCDGCWGKFASHNETLRKEIPAQWFVEGGQRWACAGGDGDRAASPGFIEFCRNGLLDSSWGKGAWKLEGQDMDVTFGKPPTSRRLRRTEEGFECVSSSSPSGGARAGAGACVSGWPLYGEPASISRFSLVPQHLSALVLSWRIVPRGRSWRRLLPLLLTLLSAVAFGLQFRQRRRRAHAMVRSAGRVS